MTAKMDKQHLNRNVIDFTGNTDGERTGARTYGNDPGVVQEGGDVVPPPQESMDNSPSLFNYGLNDPYNDLIDDFDPYLEYGKGYQTGRHLKMLFTNSGAATQLTCGVTHTMTHNDAR